MPGAQPADLPGQPTLDSIFSPPGQAALPGQQTLGQYFAGAGGTVPGIPTGQQQPQPMPTPQPNAPTPGGPARGPADALDQFGNAFQGQQPQPGQPPQDPLDQFAGAFTGVPTTMPKPGERYEEGAPQTWSEMWQRTKANVGRSPTEIASILQGSYGTENVRIRGDRVYFRKPGETKFRALDPKQFEFFGDLFADMSGNMLEAAGAAPAEYLGGTAARASAATGTPLGAVGAVGLAGAGFAGGAQMGLDLRRGSIQALGGGLDPNLNEGDEYTKSLMTNMGTAGIGKVVGSGLSKIAGALAESPIMRLKTVARVQAAIEDMANAYRIGSTTTPEQTGGVIKTVVERERSRLNGFVEAARSLVETSAQDQKFPVSNTLISLKNVLKNQGVAFDKDGTAILSGSMKPEQVQVMRQYDRMSPILGADAKPILTQEVRPDVVSIPGQPVSAPVAPLGTKEGRGELGEMVDMYNSLLVAHKNGGVDAKALFRMASDTGERGEYGTYTVGGQQTREAAGKVSSPWRAINGGAIADRDSAAMMTLSPDSPELGAYKSAMAHYQQRIQPLRDFEAMVRKAGEDGSLPNLANSVIHPGAPETIRQFKALVGTSANNDLVPGETWDMVKGSWLSSLMNSPAIKDAQTGLINGKSLYSKLTSYGPDVLKEIFPGAEMGEMRMLTRRLDGIYKGDLNPTKAVKEVVSLPVLERVQSAQNLASIMWGMMGQRADMADKLLDEGFMQMYREAAPINRGKIVGAMNQFQRMYDSSIKTRLKNGVEILTLPPGQLKMFGLSAIRGNAAGAAQGTAAAAGATMKDAKELYKGLKGTVGDALGYDRTAPQETQ